MFDLFEYLYISLAVFFSYIDFVLVNIAMDVIFLKRIPYTCRRFYFLFIFITLIYLELLKQYQLTGKPDVNKWNTRIHF